MFIKITSVAYKTWVLSCVHLNRIQTRAPNGTYNTGIRNSAKGVDLPQKNAKGPHVRLVREFLKQR